MNIRLRLLIPVLVTIQLLFVVLHLFLFVAPTYQRLDHSSVLDTGLLPKRSNNVDFLYFPTEGPQLATDVTNRYPVIDPKDSKITRRVEIAKFTNCPIFRLSDDNKSVIVG